MWRIHESVRAIVFDGSVRRHVRGGACPIDPSVNGGAYTKVHGRRSMTINGARGGMPDSISVRTDDM